MENNKNQYTPAPVDTSDIQLPAGLESQTAEYGAKGNNFLIYGISLIVKLSFNASMSMRLK